MFPILENIMKNEINGKMILTGFMLINPSTVDPIVFKVWGSKIGSTKSSLKEKRPKFNEITQKNLFQ